MIFARASEQLFSTGPEQGMLFKHMGASLYRAISAFALSVLIGIPLGFCLGLMPSVHKWTSPILSVMLPLPAVAWTPILLVAFGQGDRTIITVCFLGAFFPVLYSTIQGVKAVSKQSIWVVRSMGGKRRHVLLNVLLPSCLPALISGLKLGMAHSWRTLVAAEMLAAISTGLGYMIFAARSYMDVSTMFVGIALLALIGMAIEYGIFGVLEQRTIRKWAWRLAHGRIEMSSAMASSMPGGDGGQDFRPASGAPGLAGRAAVDLGIPGAFRPGQRLPVSPPSSIFSTLWSDSGADVHGGQLYRHVYYSMMRLLAGLALAAAVGTLIGILIGLTRWGRFVFKPLLSLFMPVPTLAWTPILLLLIGVDNKTTILIVFIAASFEVILNVVAGIENMNVKVFWVARSMGASRLQIFFKVIVPGILPYLITGVRLGSGYAWRALIAAECWPPAPTGWAS